MTEDIFQIISDEVIAFDHSVGESYLLFTLGLHPCHLHNICGLIIDLKIEERVSLMGMSAVIPFEIQILLLTAQTIKINNSLLCRIQGVFTA